MKKAAWLLLAGLMFIACGEDDGNDITFPPPPNPEFETVTFEADLDVEKVAQYPAKYDPVLLLSVSYQGEGSSNLMPAIFLEATHIEEEVSNNQFKIKEGQFTIRDNGDNMIFGTYSGSGVKNVSDFKITWNLKIDGGTGKFHGAKGNLQLVISDLDNSRSNLNQTMAARMSGHIALPSGSSF